MKSLKLSLLIFAFGIMVAPALGQKLNPNKVTYPEYGAQHRTEFVFPKVGEYHVLTCDFHTHTIFSDGLVWPTLRVAEAWTGGVDVLSITDHIEYRPFSKYTNNDHNTSYQIAKPAADNCGLILVRGTEITRTQKTIGHYNALFITDANPIAKEDPKESILEAKKQGALIIWNHPGWAVDSTYIKEFQRDLFNEGVIDGIEVFNNNEFYPRAISWAIDMNLAMISASDVHGNVERGTLRELGFERPLTLVLTKDRSLDGIKEAIQKRRTIAWFQNMIATTPAVAADFVNSMVFATSIKKDEKSNHIKITNRGSIPFVIEYNRVEYKLPALSSIMITTPASKDNYLKFNFKNIFVYEDKTLAHDLYF